MAKQTINLGTSVNKGDGDPLRTAFTKINENFDELYAGTVLDLSSVAQDIIPATDNTYDLGSPTKQWRSLYVTNNTVYFGGIPLTISEDGTIFVNGEAAATPGGATTWSSVTDKPTFAAVATSGSYDDLLDKPIIPSTSVTVSDTAPVSASGGDLWWDSENGRLKIYYADGDSEQWVDAFISSGGVSNAADSARNIESESDVNIRVNLTDSTTHTWRFGEDGDLTFPDATTQTTAFTSTYDSISTSSNSITIDFSHSLVEITLNQSINNINFINTPGTGSVKSTTVVFIQDDSGNRTVSGSGYLTQSGVGLQISALANTISVINFTAYGSTIIGFNVGQEYQ